MKNTTAAPVCEGEHIHKAPSELSENYVPEYETLCELSDFFKILGDTTRVNILFAIDKMPLCVCEIAELLGMTKSAVSHQLKILRQTALVTYRRSGKNVIYSLADDHVRDIIEKALEHVKE